MVGSAFGERKQNKSGVTGSRECRDKLSVAFVHGEDSRSLFQMCFRIFHGLIVGEIVACMAKPVEMRIETKNQGVAGRPYLGKRRFYALELCFESPDLPVRAVEGRRDEDKNIHRYANPDGRQL